MKSSNSEIKECFCQQGTGNDGACCGMCGHEDAMCCDPAEDYSNGLDIGKFVVLSVISGGIYLIYWFYRNWKHFKEYTKKPLHPAVRTVGVLFPVADIVLYCMQFIEIHRLAQKEERRTFPLLLTCVGFSLIIVLVWLLFVSEFVFWDMEAQFATQFIGFVAVIIGTLIVIPVQMSLNDIWKHAQKTKILRLWYTNGEKAWIVIGALLLFFSFVSIFFAPPPTYTDYPAFGIPGQYENNLDIPSPAQPEPENETPNDSKS